MLQNDPFDKKKWLDGISKDLEFKISFVNVKVQYVIEFKLLFRGRKNVFVNLFDALAKISYINKIVVKKKLLFSNVNYENNL